MDAGQIPPTPSSIPPRNPGTTASSGVATANLAVNDVMMDSIAETERNKSRITALVTAALVHALILVGLVFIISSNFRPEEVELVVASAAKSNTDAPEMENFAKKVTQDKPSPPSQMATNTITSAAVSSISMPTVTEFTDSPAFGTDFGDGFGMGGFGSGMGGATFFGQSGGGDRIILVIDTSTSMPRMCGADGIKAIRKEVNKTISALSPATKFNIICFGNDADGYKKAPVSANAANVAGAKEWMEDYFINRSWSRTRTSKFGDAGKDAKGIAYVPIPPSAVKALKGTTGGSRMDLALVAAFEQKPSSVFLIADGEPGTSLKGKKLSDRDIVKLIVDEAKNTNKSGKLPLVNCISIKGVGEAILKDISRKFKGKYKSIDPAKI